MKTSNKLLIGLLGFIGIGILLFILMGRFSMTSFATEKVKGNGEVLENYRTVPAFNGVKIGRGMQMMLSKGENSVGLKGESNIIEMIETTVENEVLSIRWKSGTSVEKTQPIEIKIAMPGLEYLSVSSSAVVETTDDFAGEDAHIYASSGSTVKLQGLTTESLEMDLSSSSTMRFTQGVAVANNASIQLSSGSQLNFTDFTAEQLDTDMSSSSQLSLSGSARSLTVDGSSGSEFKGAAFSVQNASFKGSSSSSFEVEVSDALTASLSSGSTVRYRGAAQVNKNLSSGSSVEKID